MQDSDDDWETDPDHINVMSEEQQRYLLIFKRKRGEEENILRWGGARDTGTLDMDKFR